MSIQYLIQVNIEIMLIILCISIWILTKVWSKGKMQPVSNIWIIDILTVGMLISDVYAIIYRGNMTVRGYYIVRAANFFNFFFLYMMSMYMCFFIEAIFENSEHGKKRLIAGKILSIVSITVILINLFVPFMYDFDEQNLYFRKVGWYANSLLQVVIIIMMTTVVFELRKEIESSLYLMMMIDILMPLITAIIQLFVYGFSIVNIAIGITQILLFMIVFRYQEMKIQEHNAQISEYNARLMLTQVQPHFMLNTLSTIQYLCKTDSDAAAETVSDLGIYLRNNMEFATSTELITFEKEINHIEKYVSIEQKRFGERIKVVYDIKERDFTLPALSVQPLVENAIKHGISKKRGGGTVELSTWRGVNHIHIIVQDDGVGYDINKPFSEDRVHIGLSIVRERLKNRCGGELLITSEAGKGTICEIKIPIEF